MVVISGGTFDVSKLIEEYPPGGIERELLEIMSQSDGKYSCGSPGELKFELKFRRAVVDSAVRLNHSGMRFAVFNKSKCNEEYWDRMDNGGFRLKEGADPATAVNDIFNHGGRYATECATAMVIVFYRAALDIFGAETFNRLFPQVTLLNWHGMDPLLRGIGDPRSVDDILYGDRAYFANPDVDPKAPQWRGENVIVLPDGLYYGHGIGIAPAERVIAALNKKRRKDAEQSAYLRKDASRPNYRRLYMVSERYAAESVPAHLVWGAFPAPVAGGAGL
jgi:protein-glutamine gamma-glutamyltransferase